MTYKTVFGNGKLLWRGKLLAGLELPGAPVIPSDSEISGITGANPDMAEADSTSARTMEQYDLILRLESYFSGEPMTFPIEQLPLDLASMTPFQHDVVRALAAVPYGRTITYGQLAGASGHALACRAVGNVMAANPFPVVIPCHRVIRGDGSLGNYSAGEGWKARLLELEGGRPLARIGNNHGFALPRPD